MPKLDRVLPDQVKYPDWNDTRVPEDAECQDTRGMVRGRYIRCGKPAKVIVALDNNHPYYMCRSCAQFCVANRGGKHLSGGGKESGAQ